jgi:urea carboxylase-associated protein 2
VWRPLPDGVVADQLTWAETVAGGNYSQKVLARGTVIQLTDVAGDACAHVLLYNADQPFERLNVADTVKVQWQVYPSAGYLLLSDQGRVLASIDHDNSGHHDTIFGASTAKRNTDRYGSGSGESASPAGRELFALAAAKNGLGRRDIPPSISFFKGVRIDDDGRAQFTGSEDAGAAIRIRIEMPAIVLIANTAHPLDPRETFSSTPLQVLAWSDRPTEETDPLWAATPEGRRAFVNTQDYLDARGIA